MSEFIHDIEWHKEHKRLGFYDPIAELAEELEKIQLSKKDATSDCISRQAAIDGFYEMASDMEHLCTVSDYVSFLESLPSAQPEPLTVTKDYEPSKDECDRLKQAMRDAPITLLPSEIIRCKDCKHSFLHDNGEKISRICGRTKMCGTTKDDWFCADAERSTE